MKKILILAKVEMTSLRKTGKMVMRDLNWFPVMEAAPEAKALVWSSDPALWERGKAWAKSEGYQPYLLDDTDDVLSKARSLALRSFSPTAP
jgi:hypothetical protein